MQQQATHGSGGWMVCVVASEILVVYFRHSTVESSKYIYPSPTTTRTVQPPAKHKKQQSSQPQPPSRKRVRSRNETQKMEPVKRKSPGHYFTQAAVRFCC